MSDTRFQPSADVKNARKMLTGAAHVQRLIAIGQLQPPRAHVGEELNLRAARNSADSLSAQKQRQRFDAPRMQRRFE
jgi:hypothetical protein